MNITREVAIRLLNVDTKRFPKFVEEGKLKVVRSGYKGRKYYDRAEVLKLAEELGKINTVKEI